MVSTMKIFNVTVPQRNGLCCAICKIVSSENDPIIYSNYCGSRLKCGQILRGIPQVMAAPITNRKLLETGSCLYIIAERDIFESIFQDHCKAFNVQLVDLVDPVPIYIYKACLLYTVEYRLAPQWNKVGTYLVEGQNFLSSTGNVHAITLNIKDIHDNSAQFHVEAVNLKIPFLRLINTVRPMQHSSMAPVRVLPSLKMATVLNISKEIKKNYQFKDYKDLCEYWKNMYGYELPEYEEGFLFYNIEFFYFKSSVFLYPEMCLTSGSPEILPLTMDPVSRIYKFAGDLRRKVTQLCGQQLDICPENVYQAATLACTPMLPRVHRFPACDSGYGKLSGKMSNITSLRRMFDTCDIPTKRSRLSLPGINNSLTCKTETDDFSLGIDPTCSTRNFDKLLKTAGSISAVLYDDDSAVASKPVVHQKDERKSHYFEQEGQESESKSFVERELADKEEKPKKGLKEKLLRNL